MPQPAGTNLFLNWLRRSIRRIESRIKLAYCKPAQHIGVVFPKAKERYPNLLALLAECRMYNLQYPN